MRKHYWRAAATTFSCPPSRCYRRLSLPYRFCAFTSPSWPTGADRGLPLPAASHTLPAPAPRLPRHAAAMTHLDISAHAGSRTAATKQPPAMQWHNTACDALAAHSRAPLNTPELPRSHLPGLPAKLGLTAAHRLRTYRALSSAIATGGLDSWIPVPTAMHLMTFTHILHSTRHLPPLEPCPHLPTTPSHLPIHTLLPHLLHASSMPPAASCLLPLSLCTCLHHYCTAHLGLGTA